MNRVNRKDKASQIDLVVSVTFWILSTLIVIGAGFLFSGPTIESSHKVRNDARAYASLAHINSYLLSLANRRPELTGIEYAVDDLRQFRNDLKLLVHSISQDDAIIMEAISLQFPTSSLEVQESIYLWLVHTRDYSSERLRFLDKSIPVDKQNDELRLSDIDTLVTNVHDIFAEVTRNLSMFLRSSDNILLSLKNDFILRSLKAVSDGSVYGWPPLENSLAELQATRTKIRSLAPEDRDLQLGKIGVQVKELGNRLPSGAGVLNHDTTVELPAPLPSLPYQFMFMIYPFLAMTGYVVCGLAARWLRIQGIQALKLQTNFKSILAIPGVGEKLRLPLATQIRYAFSIIPIVICIMALLQNLYVYQFSNETSINPDDTLFFISTTYFLSLGLSIVSWTFYRNQYRRLKVVIASGYSSQRSPAS